MTDICARNATEDCCPLRAPDLPVAGSPADEAELATIAKALGHPMRVRILRILAARQACLCGELVAELPISQATVSQHLKALRDAGLVQGEIDGPRVCYCASAKRLDRFVALLGLLSESKINTEMEVVR